ncbi:HAD family hydrolase [Arthrobacter alpinus]|uniref:HAD family hydrolase n=1 Tax=Arthrobacter alpinus TaxID=656366 RepID=A0A0S2M2S7_9MICC|nr:phosphonatase-like hydrolase [Arthrobacter alpinus]ALO68089.1 HAD family hydrolase [Arthrobacter alpinus]
MTFALVACDMAGTTIDEHGSVYRALADAVQEVAGTRPSDAQVQEWMGADKVEAITGLMIAVGAEPALELVERGFNHFKSLLGSYYAELPPIALPGVEEALATLRGRGVKIALTTGFSRDVAEPLLASLGWVVASADETVDAGEARLVLDAVVCSDEVASGRPAPFMIHRAMERTGVQDVRTVLAAGDTVNDLLAATQAGVTAVGVLTGKLGRAELSAHPHDHILDGVKDLPALFS